MSVNVPPEIIAALDHVLGLPALHDAQHPETKAAAATLRGWLASQRDAGAEPVFDEEAPPRDPRGLLDEVE